MVASTDDESRLRNASGYGLECFDHEFQPFVGAPFPECENAQLRISAPGKVRIFRHRGENSVRTEMHIVAAVFLAQNLAIAGHQDRNRVREQQNPGGQPSAKTVSAGVSYPRVREIDRIHEVMQSHVRVASAHAGEQRREQAEKCAQGTASKRAEEQIEPHHIRFKLTQHLQEPEDGSRVIERPAPDDRVTIQFGLVGRQPVRENCEGEEGIPVEFLRNVQTILAQSALAGWEGGYQTNLHSRSGLRSRPIFRCACQERCWLVK